jgi:mycofactocin system glycosyltransferase
VTTYTLDATTRRPPGSNVVIGGSPLRLFRLTDAGVAVFDDLAAGMDVPPDPKTDRLVARLLDAGAIHPRPVGGPFTVADVTVVVPALVLGESALAEIVRCCPGVATVIAVDDASEPPVGGVPGARVLRLRTNAGPAVARNAGLGAVATPLVAFVDTDVRLEPGWLDPLLAHFADPQVGLVAPRVASAPGAGPVAAYEQGHSPLDLGPAPGRIAPGTRLSYVPAAALVVRTDALRAIDGFDRQLRFGEDVDAVWRLVEAGWRCRYEPAAVVHHRPRGSWRALVAQRVAYGSSAAPLARRHPGALAPVRVSGWSGSVWGLLAAGHPLPALALAGGTTLALVRKLPGVPARESLKLAGLGHLHAGRLLADAARRAWWPALLAGSLVSKRVRGVAAMVAVPALLSGGIPRLVDDLAYGAGLWKGVLAERELGPLRPDFTSWPGRRSVEA